MLLGSCSGECGDGTLRLQAAAIWTWAFRAFLSCTAGRAFTCSRVTLPLLPPFITFPLRRDFYLGKA